MTSHIVSEAELADYIEERRAEWSRFALCSSVGQEVKRLEFSLGHVAPIYRVSLGERTIYVGALKETAVREYNALP